MYFFGVISGLGICCKFTELCLSFCFNKDMETVLEKDVNLDLNGLAKYYCLFTPKFTLNEICSLINKHHQHNVTKRRVKYLIQKHGLSRKKMDQSNELDTSRSLLGYRQIAEMISLKYEVNISKENARLALLHVDPDGVRNRRRNAMQEMGE